MAEVNEVTGGASEEKKKSPFLSGVKWILILVVVAALAIGGWMYSRLRLCARIHG